MRGQTKVGCCGFAAAQRTYFQSLRLLEVQKTFYQPPRPATAARWREKAPAGFEFALKAWQLITHEPSSPTYRRLRHPLSEAQRRQVGGFRWTGPVRHAWKVTRQMAELLEAGKVLFQCPASFRPTDENKDRLRGFFDRAPRQGLTCIWEPRGPWPPGEVAELCRELDLVHCVDPFHAETQRGGFHYFRLHGVTGYKHRHSDAELRYLAGLRRKSADTYFLFNNIAMFEDAQRLDRMLG
ncbi:MAG: DUF72 domain-containing protein [Candidatus Brocadiia bacterium]